MVAMMKTDLAALSTRCQLRGFFRHKDTVSVLHWYTVLVQLVLVNLFLQALFLSRHVGPEQSGFGAWPLHRHTGGFFRHGVRIWGVLWSSGALGDGFWGDCACGGRAASPQGRLFSALVEGFGGADVAKLPERR